MRYQSLPAAKLFQDFAATRVKLARQRVDLAGWSLGSTGARDHEVALAMGDLSEALEEYAAVTSEVQRLQGAA